ncbi:Myb-like DNA-binding domain-containing protein [Spironucleus salmonicida]|uniref:Myb-like DNA-binding domain-containing protein n=1 Tax=Spironucleus salmonicida TaxID=348837 RepID=V6LQL7_9EUKA|nr:Myb-like DNA-binding domain-containing protein [Spironucleus salmonicida]|eukprot:EST46972.1 Myb-like DNA-binding domain-containing protein [Spironucleus salmonicida]
MSFFELSFTEPYSMNYLIQRIQELENRIQILESQQSARPKEKSGHWTSTEHKQFITALMTYGFSKRAEIANQIPSRNSQHVSSHLQKFIRKIDQLVSFTLLPITFPLSILICGIARIRSEINLPLQIEFDECARAQAEFINNRFKFVEDKITNDEIAILPLNLKLGKTGINHFEIGVKQIENARLWEQTQKYYTQRLREIQRISSLKESPHFAIWYVSDKFDVEEDIVCGDYICGIVLQSLKNEYQ